MECAEAQRLLDQGVRPGSSDPRRAALGFHLAGCPACRAYRSGHDQLLVDLLSAVNEPARPAATPAAVALTRQLVPPASAAIEPASEDGERAPASAHAPRPGPPRMRRRRRQMASGWRYGLIALLSVVALGLGLMAGRIAQAALTITGNLAAMQVTAVPTRLPPTPPLSLPTAPVAASATPLPAAGVLDAVSPAIVTPSAARVLDAVPPPNEAASAFATPGVGLAAAVITTPTPRPAAPTAIQLPAIGGAPIPTLMPTFGVLPATGQALNILLLGSDRRPGESWQTRSDAIIIAHLDPARQRVALLSLPRDLMVNIPGIGYSRINAATVYGDMYPELGGGGTGLARETVGNLLGIPIDHVVRIDFSAFMAAIDAIGGIDVVVENELYDPEYPTMDYGYTVAHFFPGPQHFDGETALMYARLRHADSDYARSRRQQQVIQAAMQRVRDQNILGQIDMLADLSDALRDNIQTDLSLDQMVGIAWAFRNYAPDQVERYALDENMTSVGLPGDQYAISANPGAIGLLVGQLLGQ